MADLLDDDIRLPAAERIELKLILSQGNLLAPLTGYCCIEFVDAEPVAHSCAARHDLVHSGSPQVEQAIPLKEKGARMAARLNWPRPLLYDGEDGECQ